ncbi:multiple pdz domain protein, partial [Plakobranchus ocellatus]
MPSFRPGRRWRGQNAQPKGLADLSITYIPGSAINKEGQGSTSTPHQSPLLQKLAQSLEAEEPPTVDSHSNPAHSPPPTETLEVNEDSKSPLGQKTLLTDGSPAVGNQAWGPPRSVQLVREAGKSLGISIVGGRVDMFNVSQEHSNAGIFIKHVLGDSPAGRNGTLKKGDRILEVNGVDVRNATHDEAVEVIRNSDSPINFVVQSLSYSTCPGDLDSSQLKAVQSFEESASASPMHTPPVAAATTSSSPAPFSSATTAGTISAVTAPLLGTQTSLTSSSPGSTPQQSFEQGNDKMAGESFSDSEDEDEFGYTKKQVQKKYADLPGLVQLVELDRGSAGMGLGLAGNKDRSKMSVFVAGIQPGSPAAWDGRIQVGDELLEVNGINLNGLSHLNASAVIKGVTTPIVKLITHRRRDFQEHMAVKPLRYGGSSQFDAQSVPPVSPRGATEAEGGHPVGASRRESAAAAAAATSPKSPPKPAIAAPGLNPTDTFQIITLQKNGSQGLGFGIHEQVRNGKQGIFVKSITQGGIADKDNQLEIGDEILEVGDRSLAGLHYDKAIDILRAAQGTVRLKICKNVQQNNNLLCPPSQQSGLPQAKIQLLNTLGESSTDPVEPEENGDPRTCPILLGKRTSIEIEKGKTGLGLSIVGGSDTLLGAIIIHEVYEDGAAARDGRLWAGDQILEVNSEDLTEATHNRALQVLRQTPPIVRMAVYRDEGQVREEDILDVFTVELVKRPGKGLGLSIVGKKSDVGIYISDIVKGGVAEADGRLMQGDQILAVNGEDMRNSTQEYAAAVLKTLMGKVNLTVGRLKAGSKASSRKNSNPGTSLKKSDSSVSNRSKGRHSK